MTAARVLETVTLTTLTGAAGWLLVVFYSWAL